MPTGIGTQLKARPGVIIYDNYDGKISAIKITPPHRFAEKQNRKQNAGFFVSALNCPHFTLNIRYDSTPG